jgi:hypothetical protein
LVKEINHSKEEIMANKRFWLGILVMILVFGMTVLGCDLAPEEVDNGFTFEFNVIHYDFVWRKEEVGGLAKIEFINGSNENAPVLQTEINPDGKTYKVTGFTVKSEIPSLFENRVFCVRVTYGNGTILIGGGEKDNNSKVNIEVQYNTLFVL